MAAACKHTDRLHEHGTRPKTDTYLLRHASDSSNALYAVELAATGACRIRVPAALAGELPPPECIAKGNDEPGPGPDILFAIPGRYMQELYRPDLALPAQCPHAR